MKSANPEDWEDNETLDLFPTGEQLKEQGQAQVLKNTPETWYLAMFQAASKLLDERGKFTSEDLRAIAGEPPGHYSAVGAAVNQIVKKLNLRSHGRINSRRRKSHAAKIEVWGK